MLLRTFGRTMGEVFLLPYNRKMWRRPLSELAPSGFQWNIARPEFASVLRGALSPETDFKAYNARGWYPRPAKDAPLRGMEVLSSALASQARDLRLAHTVESIDLEKRTVAARGPDGVTEFTWRRECLSTLPLPVLIDMSAQATGELRDAARSLTRNRVITAAFSVEGPRPQGRGNWRYYADEGLIFTRLIYLHEFDPGIAPEQGWVLMTEITQRAEDPLDDEADLLATIRRDIRAAGALPDDCKIVDEHLLVIDPAYVVFTPENFEVMDELRSFLTGYGVTPLGRYGRWEYSSMAQVMRDGFTWAEEAIARSGPSSGESPPGGVNIADA
jgi:protoporphyrinogen oxidase